MRKVISGALAAAVIAGNVPLNVMAEEINLSTELTGENANTVNESKITKSGKLEVDINLELPVVNENKAGININLKKEKDIIAEMELGSEIKSSSISYNDKTINYTVKALAHDRVTEVEDGGKVYYYRVIFDGLEAGSDCEYSLEINGNGFSGMATDVMLDSYSKRVVVNNISSNEKNGAILFGDVDDSGNVDRTDYNAVYKSIGKYKAEYDINRDGKVNILDLAYIKKNMGKTAGSPIEENMDPIIDTEKVTISSVEGQEITGNSADLFSDTSETVQISTGEKEISKENPAKLDIDLSGMGRSAVEMEQIVIKGGTNGPSAGTVEVDGKIYTFGTNDSDVNNDSEISTLSRTSVRNGDIVINLEGQKAVSKITINVTATTSNDRNLVEIAKVEFLNNVYKEIPKPDMNIPKINSVKTSTKVAHESMEISWGHEENVTGYEVKVETIDNSGKATGVRTFKTSENNLKVRDIKAYARYRVSVQSLNGEWKGGYKEADENDKNGVIDNIENDSIASGNYVPKTFDPDGIINILVVPDEKPEPPEGISVKGKYKSIDVNWKAHNSAQSFDVYYRKMGASETEFKKANTEPIVNKTSYTIGNLEDGATYEIKLTATNHLGTSGMSQGVTGKTSAITIPNTSNYNLINLPNGQNELMQHVTSVEFPRAAADEYLDIFDEDCVVDNDYTTAWALNNWDGGINSRIGPIVTFDQKYTMDTITVVTRGDNLSTSVWRGIIKVWNDETKSWEEHEASVYNRNNNGNYTILKLNKPVTTNKVQVNIGGYAYTQISIAELKFYKYDSIEKDVKNLFKDELQIELRDDMENPVTQDEIDALRERLNTEDPNTGEYHPEKTTLMKEIQIAEDLLRDQELSEDIITVDPLINNSGVNTGYGNDWQALGYTAKAGDTINIYMATNDESKQVWFGYEQHYAESGSYISKEKIVLKPGKNTIQIDQLTDLNVEKGGNLYVRFPYSVDSSNVNIKIRVSGAKKTPHLNLNNYLNDVDYLVNNKDNNEDPKVKAVKDKLRAYITKLDTHVSTMKDEYKVGATEEDNINNVYSYDEKTSILNSTNIEGDRFTLTLPATEVYKGIKEGASDIDAQVDKLYDTVLAWEQIIQITNAKKGVYEKVADFNGNGEVDSSDNAEYNKNKASRNRVNVKYQRMFIGAFMYASGHHVGVEMGSAADLMNGVPFKFDESGNVTNPNEAKLFGWGISHEIGHKADIGSRTYSETTNNLLALITQTFDGKDKSRLEENKTYDSIYKKVTSGSVGVSQDINTLLGMFWQLHLAYEPGNTSQMLKNNSDNNPNNDSYFAKMNRAYRNTANETSDKNQLLIRRASDAAGKDLRAFFASWGIIADESTSIYLQQKFPNAEDKETRKIQYLNDESFRKRLEGVTDMSEDTAVEASFVGTTPGSTVKSDSVKISMNVTGDKENKEKILGYEIIRSDGNYFDGESNHVAYRPVGFVNASADGSATFTDSISPLNNRTATYKVVAYDYNLNATEEYEIGSIKFSHDGNIDSSKFVLKSNLTSDETNENSNRLDNIKDSDSATSFKGRKLTASEYNNDPHKVDDINVNADPYIVMDLQGSKSISGLKYTKSSDAVSRFSLKRLFSRNTSYEAISSYEIHISNDNKNWTKVSEGKFDFGNHTIIGGADDENTAKVLFNKNGNLYTYDARYVKFVAKGATNIDIADIGLIGSTGDNIEIGAINSENGERTNGIGRLESDFVVQADNTPDDGKDDTVKIPAGSIVITGEYKGNPAFNVPLLIDENNRTISGEAILMANVPDDSPLGSVADGKWIYWIPAEKYETLTGRVKAELYRYNELNSEGAPIGQRLVSDTLYVEIGAGSYEELPTIKLENSGLTKSNSKATYVNTDIAVREDK